MTNNEIKTQVYVINTAIGKLERNVKPPKDEMQRTYFVAAIEDIKAALSILKPLVNPDDSESRH